MENVREFLKSLKGKNIEEVKQIADNNDIQYEHNAETEEEFENIEFLIVGYSNVFAIFKNGIMVDWEYSLEND